MSDRKKDFFSALFFLALSVFIYAQSYAITMSTADALGPQFFPRLVSYVMAALALIQVWRFLRTKKAEDEQATKFSINLPLLGTIGILVLYFLLLKRVGFILLTSAYLLCQMLLLLPSGSIKKKRTVIVAAAVSIVAPAAIYNLFYHVFSIFLPAGILG